MAALGCIAALLVLTVADFLPLNATFNAGTLPIDEVPAKPDAWLAVHWVRIALAFTAAALGMVAAIH